MIRLFIYLLIPEDAQEAPYHDDQKLKLQDGQHAAQKRCTHMRIHWFHRLNYQANQIVS